MVVGCGGGRCGGCGGGGHRVFVVVAVMCWLLSLVTVINHAVGGGGERS